MYKQEGNPLVATKTFVFVEVNPSVAAKTFVTVEMTESILFI